MSPANRTPAPKISGPLPSWPKPFWPQHATRPSRSIAHECVPPAEVEAAHADGDGARRAGAVAEAAEGAVAPARSGSVLEEDARVAPAGAHLGDHVGAAVERGREHRVGDVCDVGVGEPGVEGIGGRW